DCRGRDRRIGHLSVYRPHDHRAETLHSDRTVQGPQLCGRAGADVRDRDDPGIQFSADGAVAAESGELSGGNRWADHGPTWHRDYDSHDEWWPACQPVRPAQGHGGRYTDACLVNV